MSQLASKVFKYRSYTPIPFLILMVAFQEATPLTMLVGFAIILLGEFIRISGVSYAGSETRTTGTVGGTFLVVSGGFAYVRNPLYLGNILIYFGVGIMSWALFPYLQIVALVFFFIQYKLIIDEEENYLVKTYGKQYENYKANVPKLIPRLTPYKNPGIEQPKKNINAALRSERRTLQAISFVVLLIVVIYLINNWSTIFE
ncbi:MAG: isoprenylcysteine carboxylmethyltransferase family protein [Melioribacteraceae bacterium]|jgi:protein-S-isoprenylcysteine O-methyltransferase Ste14|nr:isoprenylcysteine carboxylmethyltransferase family protein [Melioribacteraceae bacterium]RJP60775.1 MAG: isoprenylcysteine carboxylmethyltransferase family protein [Ignavibacteriales bacterium]WKZ68603.1 MAG: isoprenylcysteine carboxylmethyltransferase family protein [Melioribacteraceae bacterium]